MLPLFLGVGHDVDVVLLLVVVVMRLLLGVLLHVLVLAVLGDDGDVDLALLGLLLVNVAIGVLGLGVVGLLLVVSFC